MPNYWKPSHGDWCNCEECSEWHAVSAAEDAQENPTLIDMGDLDAIPAQGIEASGKDAQRLGAQHESPTSRSEDAP